MDQSTISRDIKVLKENVTAIVFDLAKSDLAYYYKQSIDGIEEAKKEAWPVSKTRKCVSLFSSNMYPQELKLT